MPESQDAGFEGNPFRSPSFFSDAPAAGDPSGQVTPRVLSMLRQTQPWVRFLSVLGFIGCGLMMLIGLIGFVAMALAPPRGASPAPFFLLIYIPMGLLYFFPSLFLFRYASRISALWTTRNVRDLEDALAAQKSFWKFVGILTLVMIVLYVLAIGFFIMGTAAMRMH